VDADTGNEVEPNDIVKGYKIDTDTYITVEPEELEKVEIESSRTIEIDEFVDRVDIDQRYVVRPYWQLGSEHADRRSIPRRPATSIGSHPRPQTIRRP
jgi:non-homologous end joining protein Ku